MSKLSKISEEMSMTESAYSNIKTKKGIKHETSSISEIYDSDEEEDERDIETSLESNKKSAFTKGNKRGAKNSTKVNNVRRSNGKKGQSKAIRLINKNSQDSDDEMSVDRKISKNSNLTNDELQQNESIKRAIETIDTYAEHYDNWDDEIEDESKQYNTNFRTLDTKSMKNFNCNSNDILKQISTMCSNYSVLIDHLICNLGFISMKSLRDYLEGSSINEKESLVNSMKSVKSDKLDLDYDEKKLQW